MRFSRQNILAQHNVMRFSVEPDEPVLKWCNTAALPRRLRVLSSRILRRFPATQCNTLNISVARAAARDHSFLALKIGRANIQNSMIW